MNRKELKSRAKELIQGRLWELITPYFLLMLFSFIINLLITQNIPNGEGGYWGILTELILFPMLVGIYAFYLNFTRKKPQDLKTVFSFYNLFFPIIILYILQMLFATLWALLLIVPGIIAAISYTMAPFILIDGESDPMTCIRKSKKMMMGYKWDFFVFMLSFIGWMILSILTFGIALIYAIPYVMISEVLYYEELKKITKFD